MITERPPGSDASSRWRVLLATGLAVGWFGLLALLTVTTANPVTVNRQQLLTSDAVVVGRADRASIRGEFLMLRIEEVLAGRDLPASLRVGGIEAARFENDGAFVVPLRETESGYVVTPAPEAFKNAPLVYPATDDVREAVERILATRAPKPYQ